MTLPIINGAGAPTNLASDEAGGIHTPHHKVTALPGSSEADILGTKTATVAADTKLGTIVTALGGHLATLAGAVTSNRVAVNLSSAVDTLLTTIATGPAKLDSIITALALLATNQAPPAAGPKFGRNDAIGSGSDAVFPSRLLARGMVVRNLHATIDLLISDAPGPTPTGATTTTVKGGGVSGFIACTNANVPYMRSASGTISACYEGA